MKKTLVFIALTALVMLYSSCSKTCSDASAPNFNQSGTCNDLTAELVGTYSGSYEDSVAGTGNTQGAASLTVTKVDDGHIQITAPGLPWFVTVNTTVRPANNGTYTLNVQTTTTNGVVVTGAGAYFGQSADGAYNGSTHQLALFATVSNNGTTFYEAFLGNR